MTEAIKLSKNEARSALRRFAIQVSGGELGSIHERAYHAGGKCMLELVERPPKRLEGSRPSRRIQAGGATWLEAWRKMKLEIQGRTGGKRNA